MLELILANLLVIACVWTGINSCWGAFVSLNMDRALKRCLISDKDCPKVTIQNYHGSAAILSLSIVLFCCLVVSGFTGSFVILESLLAYNVFYSVFLGLMSYELGKLWDFLLAS